MVWQDRRVLPICEKLEAEDGPATVERTGMIIVPNDAACKIRWFLDNDEAVARGVAEGRLVYGTMDTWLIWKLSGGGAHVTDHSNNSVTLLQNASTLDYDEKTLELLNIPREILPEIHGSSEIYAYTTAEAFFGAEVPIAGICGDQQAAAFGQGCMEPGTAKNTYGTGSFMVMNTGGKYVPPSDGIFSPVLWTIDGKTDYGLEGMADVSGAVIQWLRDGLGVISESGGAEALARTVDRQPGGVLRPGLCRPGRALLRQLRPGHHLSASPGAPPRPTSPGAALESMAFQVRDAFKVMEKKSGMHLAKLRADGGGAKSDFMLQFQADILGVPVERPVITETTCLGSVYLAGLAVGYWDSVEQISRFWKIEKRFEPAISAEKREALCAGWDAAIAHAKGWLKR